MLSVSFLQRYIEQMYHQHAQWIHFMQESEDVPSEKVRSAFSSLLNIQHIWNAQIGAFEAESELNDLLPLFQWDRLNQDNFATSQQLLLSNDANQGGMLEGIDADRWMYLINAVYEYRGRLRVLCEIEKIQLPDIQFTHFNH